MRRELWQGLFGHAGSLAEHYSRLLGDDLARGMSNNSNDHSRGREGPCQVRALLALGGQCHLRTLDRQAEPNHRDMRGLSAQRVRAEFEQRAENGARLFSVSVFGVERSRRARERREHASLHRPL